MLNCSYHHTISATLLYGLREALAIICRERLEKTIVRHEDAAKYLYEGLKKLGMELYVEDIKNRLPTITAVKVPKGIDWKALSDFAAKNHSMEIAGGLGPTAGQIIRIGLMGENARRQYVDQVLRVLTDAIRVQSKL